MTTSPPLSIDEALSRLSSLPPVAAVETVALGEALGRVLAEDVVSGLAMPPHDNSAMDGVVLRAADLATGATTRLRLVGTIAAGHPALRPLEAGEAMRIFTGAPLPPGGDTVVMQEECRFAADAVWVEVPPGVHCGDHVRAAGEDVGPGEVVLETGIRLMPQHVGVAALVGRRMLAVRRPLTVAVLSTGDELREPGTPLPAGAIWDSNRYTVAALARRLGCRVLDLGIVPDHFEAVRETLDTAAAGADVVITSGGVSVGGEDHVKAAVQALGSLDLWRLAMKPGKPLALGRLGAAHFIGLPGNPVSAMVTFLLVARPLLLRLMGALPPPPLRGIPVRAAFTHRKRPGRRTFLRARLVDTEAGLEAELYRTESSGVLTSMTWAEGLVDLPEAAAETRPGDIVRYHALAELLS